VANHGNHARALLRSTIAYSPPPMGLLDQFAKDTFALETPQVTRGGAAWQLPPELGMSEVRLDGLLRILDPALLLTLAPPWSHIGRTDELVLEVKMVGEHMDVPSFDRASLRRLARQIQRCEDPAHPFEGEIPLWYVASHVSAVVRKRRPVTEIAPGCYRIGPEWLATTWIAANELPLLDELVPFLIARTGRPLDEFVRWVKTRRPVTWLMRVLELLPMSTATYDELHEFAFLKTDDPGVRARQNMILEWVLEALPEKREEFIEKGVEKGVEKGIEKGALQEARAALRSVLDARGLALGASDAARIDACDVHDTLKRWLRQAAVAASAAEALR
jgi:hypothetical protein